MSQAQVQAAPQAAASTPASSAVVDVRSAWLWRPLSTWLQASEPLPVVVTPQALSEAEALLAQFRSAVQTDIIEELEALSRHYADWDRFADDEVSRIWRDWLDDLRGVPFSLLVEACRRWRNGPAKRRPTPGQLKEMVGEELDALGVFKARVAAARAALADPAARSQSAEAALAEVDADARARALGWRDHAERLQAARQLRADLISVQGQWRQRGSRPEPEFA